MAAFDQTGHRVDTFSIQKENSLKQHSTRWGLLAVLLLGTMGPAHADTFVGVLPATPGGSNYQAYYDSTLNLTLLANATIENYMTWTQANNWAAGLNIDGVTGWTLPKTNEVDPTCNGQASISATVTIGYGTNCTGSPLGHLFYDVFGGTQTNGIANEGPFQNIQPTGYWTSTPVSVVPGNAWAFSFFDGTQLFYPNSLGLYAWAVHAGDAGAPQTSTATPEPGVFSLMLTGLLIVGFAVRRRLKRA